LTRPPAGNVKLGLKILHLLAGNPRRMIVLSRAGESEKCRDPEMGFAARSTTTKVTPIVSLKAIDRLVDLLWGRL
jgi:hypothetical protein